MNRPTCETCPFWAKPHSDEASSAIGQCRRSAPRPAECFDWAKTYSTDWCGEHPDFPEWRRRERAAIFQKQQVERKQAEEGFAFAKVDDYKISEVLCEIRKDLGPLADMVVGLPGESFWKDWIIQECFLRGYHYNLLADS